MGFYKQQAGVIFIVPNSENTESVSGSSQKSGVSHAVRDRNANGETPRSELEPVAEALEIRTETERVLNCQNYINDKQLMPCEEQCVNCK